MTMTRQYRAPLPPTNEIGLRSLSRRLAPFPAPLLGASVAESLPGARREDGSGDRRGSRRDPEADGDPSVRSGEDPGPASLDPSRAGEEVAGAAPPRGQQGGAPGLLRGLRPVRRRLSHGRREAQERRSQPGLPAGLLPTGVAVRRRVGQAPRIRPEDGVVQPPEEAERERCIRRGVWAINS